MEIWDSVSELIPQAIEKGGLSPADAIAIGITNQRETIAPLGQGNRETDPQRHRLAVPADHRHLQRAQAGGHEDIFRETTGLVIDAYFSGTKVKWLLDNVAGRARARGESGSSCSAPSTPGYSGSSPAAISHATDYTNASRTLMFNIKKRSGTTSSWRRSTSRDSMLPEVQASASNFGATKGAPGLPDGITIGGIAGDQQAAMVGQGCVKAGIEKHLRHRLLHAHEQRRQLHHIRNGLLTTLACDNFGQPGLRPRGLGVHRRRGDPVAPGLHEVLREQRRIGERWRDPWPRKARWCSSPPSWASARPTGTWTPGAPCSG